jgi:hypothetical protein
VETPLSCPHELLSLTSDNKSLKQMAFSTDVSVCMFDAEGIWAIFMDETAVGREYLAGPIPSSTNGKR